MPGSSSNSIRLEEEFPTPAVPLRSGVVVKEDGTLAYKWALFSRADAEKAVGWTCDVGDPDEFATLLTGWRHYYGGPGRRFCDEPDLRVVRNHVLVTQRCGLDI